MTEPHDAVVVGSGPNGLAAAIAVAQAGRRVLVLEGEGVLGGGTRTEELTLPGFRHDVCSAIHPLALASPFLRRLPLDEHGLRFLHPPIPVAHPLDDGTAAVLRRSLDDTVDALGADGAAYRRLLERPTRSWEAVVDHLLAPPLRVPRSPRAIAPLVPLALRSASGLAHARSASMPAPCSPATLPTRCARSRLPAPPRSG